MADPETLNPMPATKHIFYVPQNQSRIRLDVFLSNRIESLTRSRIQKLILGNNVTVNNIQIKPSHIVQPNDEIQVTLPEKETTETQKEDIPLDIVFEDEHIIVVNKTPGRVVHPAYGNLTGTLVNALLYHYEGIGNVGDRYRPGIVHRLDKDTSGLLVVAKNDFALQTLSAQFKDRTISREYNALVWGQVREHSKRIVSHITRSKRDRTRMIKSDTGKEAITNYRVWKQFPLAAQLSIKLETGRTHQIRVHMAAEGHPVIADSTYGGGKKQVIHLNQLERRYALELLNIIPRQALHAKKLGFDHPVTGKRLEFDSEIPSDMQMGIDFLSNLEKSLH